MRDTRLCDPCKHLEDLTYPRVMSGSVHRGGLRAQILSEGVIRVGEANAGDENREPPLDRAGLSHSQARAGRVQSQAVDFPKAS